MVFNSLVFFIFLGIVYALYRLLPFRGQNWLLLVAGYVFYGWWDVRFLFLISFSTTVDFWIGLLLSRGAVPRSERVIASLFIVTAAACFLNLDWGALSQGQLGAILAPSTLGLQTLAGTIAIVLIANATHNQLLSMQPERRRRLLLFVTVGVNLGFLGIFKYFNFFAESAERLLHAVGWNVDPVHLSVVLPVGISFYTFQSLSYTIDSARGRVKPVEHFWDFALFVAFFPPMVAGPIERARHLLPQLLRPRHIRLNQSTYGVQLILYGLFKKVAVADGLAVSVNSVYNSSGTVSSVDVGFATLLFAFQIFCDFSGYTDIARGVAKLFGIELSLNFDLPYFSRNPSEFWRRWHISLSSWLRDYLYIELGGNRRGNLRTYLNLIITMVLGGLWHGAAANFLLWGAYQGALLAGHRLLTGREEKFPTDVKTEADAPPSAPRRFAKRVVSLARIAFFFLFVCYGWLLFRATSLEQIIIFTEKLVGLTPYASSVMMKPPVASIFGLVILLCLQLAEWVDGRRDVFRFWPTPLQGALYAVIIFDLFMGMSNAPAQFIYFQF
ncbi:MBOAT family O-acyltransferase [Bradyrhizobium sp. LTSP857]|uniref:MBOAT family O-acyltransferase n=1 Tax=Bradyrhizobium sp. LTSP857 TaxID=1619231 RepID=UPI0005D1C788|nr:MBOAT family O-acyltransferase [Bradyrhizobium sp. LTSP857]KJC36467.1 hypothetical protein UP06_32645 [Bradyrhizobium sp. LTSP857]